LQDVVQGPRSELETKMLFQELQGMQAMQARWWEHVPSNSKQEHIKANENGMQGKSRV
jgi:hypothetical protein